jgi:hypothetical protein
MSYKEKFTDSEWLKIYSLPVWFVNVFRVPSVLKKSPQRVSKHIKLSEKYLANPEFFESGLMKCILKEFAKDSSNKAVLYFESVKTRPKEELEIVAAALNRKLSDEDKAEFITDLLNLYIALTKEQAFSEDELNQFLSEDLYMSMLRFIGSN